jgi:hypothetical protein
MDYDLHRPARHCAKSGRELAEGETIWSLLRAKGAELERLDYALDAWSGPPEGAIGWWKSQIPRRDSKKANQTPTEVLLDLMAALESEPKRYDMRYVLALLLVRRRVLRLEQTEHDTDGVELLMLHCARDESVHRVRACTPSAERIAQIEAELAQLLCAPTD